jgi:DNA-directed RNA polymerase specialized sigma24 family protein
MPPRGKDIVEKLLSNIKVDAGGCFLWQKSKNSKGYDMTSYNGKIQTAHRTSFQVFRREIPEGMLVCHRCDVRHCINPAHLFLGTAKQNTQDAIAKDRLSRGEDHATAKLTDAQVSEIVSQYNFGGHPADIADAFNVSESWIRHLCSKNPKRRHANGVNNKPDRIRKSRPLLRKEERELLIDLLESGFSVKEIARRVGVSTARVYQIKRERKVHG